MNFPITRAQRIDWIRRSLEPHLGISPEADEYIRHARWPGFEIKYLVVTYADGRRETTLRILIRSEDIIDGDFAPRLVLDVTWDETGTIEREYFKGGAWEGHLRELCARTSISIIIL